MNKWFEKTEEQYREDLKTADENDVLFEARRLLILIAITVALFIGGLFLLAVLVKNVIFHPIFIFGLIMAIIIAALCLFFGQLTAIFLQAFYDIRVIKDPNDVRKRGE